MVQSVYRIIGAGDLNIFLYFNHRMHCRFMDMLMPLCTFLGGAAFTIGLSLILIIFGQGDLRMAAVNGAISLILSFIIGYILKKVLGRPRPYKVIPDIYINDKMWRDYSFPSGHTAAGFSLAISYTLVYPAYASLLLIGAVLVGLSRIYLGHHYPTDVLAGAALGSSIAICVNLL